MSGRPRYTVQQVEAALRQTGGLRSGAAQRLGCSPAAITGYLRRHPQLEQVIAEVVESQLDTAEHGLLSAIREGNLSAIIFFLKCKGKHRGYVERGEVTGPDGAPILVGDLGRLTDEQLHRIVAGAQIAVARSCRARVASSAPS